MKLPQCNCKLIGPLESWNVNYCTLTLRHKTMSNFTISYSRLGLNRCFPYFKLHPVNLHWSCNVSFLLRNETLLHSDGESQLIYKIIHFCAYYFISSLFFRTWRNIMNKINCYWVNFAGNSTNLEQLCLFLELYHCSFLIYVS